MAAGDFGDPRDEESVVKIGFISSFAVITERPADSRRLYVDGLGLPLEDSDGYLHSDKVDGSRHFGVWPLAQAAQSCFGTPEWPADRPVPQASVEFEVEDVAAVAAAAVELRGQGHELLHDARAEPWGQTVARLISPENVVVGISYAPWMH